MCRYSNDAVALYCGGTIDTTSDLRLTTRNRIVEFWLQGTTHQRHQRSSFSGSSTSPSGAQVRSPGRGSEGLCPPEDESLCRYCLQILTAETIKSRKFRTICLLILDQYASQCGLSDILGLSPSPITEAATDTTA